MVKQKRSLASTHRKLAREWHPTKNGEIAPKDVTAGSGKEVWWKCPTCNEPFKQKVCNRTKGQGCSYCAGKKVGKKNNLAYLYPNLVKEWHPTKNGDLTPYDVTAGSGKEVWWLCSTCGEPFKQMIKLRKNGCGCSYCAGTKVGKQNNLAYLYPNLAKEWHHTKNGDLTPYDVTLGSNKKVWWLCSDCEESYDAIVAKRTIGENCPYCAGKRVGKRNNLAYLYPDLAKEYHPTKNGDLTPYDITPGSGKEVWWLCSACKEEFKAAICDRKKGGGCSYCAGKKVGKKNNLAHLYPDLIKEWHSSKNGDLTPYGVTPGSNIRVWWRCGTCNNEWTSKVCNRVRHPECPHCLGLFRTIEYVETLIAGTCLNCLSASYDGTKTHVHLECDLGHDFWRTPERLQHTTSCPECNGHQNYKMIHIHEEAKLRYGECLDPIRGPMTDRMRLTFIDEHGELFQLTAHELFGTKTRAPMWSNGELYRI